MLSRQGHCSGQLGFRDVERLYGITQTLADTSHSQQAVLEDNAGAGTAGCGHGREGLPLVLLWVECFCCLQDSGLVS